MPSDSRSDAGSLQTSGAETTSAKWRITLSPGHLVLLFSAILAGFYNQRFWQIFFENVAPTKLENSLFILATFLFLTLWFNLILNFTAIRRILKPALIFVLLVASLANYFQSRYGTVINSSMIHNLFQTDQGEATELISSNLILYFGLYFVAPAAALVWIPLRWPPLRRHLINRLVVLLLSVIGLAALFFGLNKDFSFTFRQTPVLRSLINPTYPIHSFIKALREANAQPKELQAIGLDAKQQASFVNSPKKTVAVFVVGETARAQNFSLNGYQRDTNPELSLADITNFPKTRSCGTSTAESLPCMFSHLSRDDYSPAKANGYENLLDVLKHGGVNSLWIDNQSGCKGICDRSESVSTNDETDPRFCADGACYDEIMLAKLKAVLKAPGDKSSDHFVVLHQEGSHGPAYFKRVPDQYRVFLPECRSVNLQECTQEEVRNSYDNTILYTDHFLAEVIRLLKAHEQDYQLVMYYVSDHGESLGENGLYLHGMPYLIAPEGQTHVPSVLWMSEDFKTARHLTTACLARRAQQEISHDNLFHSALGALGVSTKIYQPGLDLFQSCQSEQIEENS